MGKIIMPQLGIDPGISGGGICARVQTLKGFELKSHKMVESFRDIKEILKPYQGSPYETGCRCSIEKLNLRPLNNPFANMRMQPMITNFNRLKDALMDLYIPFQEVSPVTWQKFHNLVLPKNCEKGIDYRKLELLKQDQRHIPIHLSIEKKVPNDEIIMNDIRYILETSGREAARKALKDDMWHLNIKELSAAKKQVEKDIEKIKAKEKQVRKKRYQDKAIKLAGRKVPLWEADALLLLTYEIYNKPE